MAHALRAAGELLLVAALAALPYAGTLRAGWTYDDKVAVQGNPDVTRREVPLADVWAHDFWGNDMSGARAQGGWTHFSWRPLVTLSFRADFLRAGGALDASTFHATNVAIHAAACVAALWALRAVAGPRARGRALLAACLFALHPVHSECVANVTSRSDALAAVFQAAALALHATGPGVECPDAAAPRAPRARWLALALHGGTPSWRGALRFVGVLACTLAALACKETALVTPALLVALDALRALGRARVQQQADAAASAAAAAACDAGGRGAGAPPPPPRPAFLPCAAEELLRSGCAPRCVAYAALAGAAFVGRVLVMARGYDLAGFANEIHNPFKQLADPLARSLSVPFVQAFALSQLLVPLTLQHEHHAMRLVYSLADPRNAFTVAVAALYACVALLAARRLGVRTARGGSGSSCGGGGGGITQQQPTKKQLDTGCKPLTTGTTGTATEVAAAAAAAVTADAAVAASVGSGVRLAYGLALIAIAYAPASHVLLYVAFTVAERTLFLPSAGACLLLAELAASAHAALTPHDDGGGGGSSAGGGVAQRDGSPSPSSPPPPPPPPGKLAAGAAAMTGGDGRRRSRAPTAAGARRCAWRAAVVPAAVAALCCFYAGRTVARAAEWSDEGTLLESSMAAYPNNAMSQYGLGALALYEATAHAGGGGGSGGGKGGGERGAWPPERVAARLAQAEELLSAAAATTSLAEPHILLSQLFWRHGVRGGDARAGWAAAEAALARLENTSLARKEAWGNLGLLRYYRGALDAGGAGAVAGWERGRAEYLVLAAHVAHGYPPAHASIALLANNAGCMRLLSHAGRYGHWPLAAAAFVEAVLRQEAAAGYVRPRDADAAMAAAAGAAGAGASGDAAAAAAAAASFSSETPFAHAVARVFALLPPPDLAVGDGVLPLPSVYANAALVAAVAGDLPGARALLARGARVLARSADVATQHAAAAAPGDADADAAMAAHLRGALEALASTRLALELHGGTIHRWGARGPSAGASVGAELRELQDALGDSDGPLRADALLPPGAQTLAERRLAALGDLPCTMELLWW